MILVVVGMHLMALAGSCKGAYQAAAAVDTSILAHLQSSRAQHQQLAGMSAEHQVPMQELGASWAFGCSSHLLQWRGRGSSR